STSVLARSRPSCSVEGVGPSASDEWTQRTAPALGLGSTAGAVLCLTGRLLRISHPATHQIRSQFPGRLYGTRQTREPETLLASNDIALRQGEGEAHA